MILALLPFVTVAPDHWNLQLRGGLEATHSAGRALHMVIDSGVRPGSSYAQAMQRVDGISGGTRLTASVWCRGAAADVRLALVFHDHNGAEISLASSPPESAKHRWRRISLNTIAPSGAASLDFSIQLRSAGYASFDDADLSAKPLSNPGFEQGWLGWRQGDNDANVGALWINGVNFVPWGVNYDRSILNGKDLILEEIPIDKVDRDFRVAHQLGANAIRLFLQLSRFMPRYMEMDPSTLAFLDQVILRARKHDLRIDLTGLSHVNAADVPAWYNDRGDDEIMAAERHFWETIARRYAQEPAVFLYDLQNEPFVARPGAPLKPVGCFRMSGGRQFCYVNPHFKETHSLSREALARQWTQTMTEAIRRFDKRHLITIGLLPGAAAVFGTGNPGFNIPALAPLLDVIAIHLYPDRTAPEADFLEFNQDWLEMTLRYASGFGKPVIVEEWFPLYPRDVKTAAFGDWFPHFMKASIGNASGWFTFYHALCVDGAEKAGSLPNELLRQFREHHLEMETRTLLRAPADTTLSIDPGRLWQAPEDVKRLFEHYRQLRHSGAQVDFTAPR